MAGAAIGIEPNPSQSPQWLANKGPVFDQSPAPCPVLGILQVFSKWDRNRWTDRHTMTTVGKTCAYVCVLVAQSCLTLHDRMDYSPRGSSVQWISHERILEWVAIFFSRGSSSCRDQTSISCIGRWTLLPLSHLRSQENTCSECMTRLNSLDQNLLGEALESAFWPVSPILYI